MRLQSWIALAGREFRGSAGRLAFFAACLSVGVAAVVAVAALSTLLAACDASGPGSMVSILPPAHLEAGLEALELARRSEELAPLPLDPN